MKTNFGLFCDLCPIAIKYPIRYKIIIIDNKELTICENCCKTLHNSDYITAEK